MQTRQIKTYNSNSAIEGSASIQKAACSAAYVKQLPAWTNVWGNRPPMELLRVSLQTPDVQTNLTINRPGDIYEQEADRVVYQVMRMPSPSGLIQRQCACGRSHGPGEEECEGCAKRRISIQRHPAHQNQTPETAASPLVHEVVSSNRGRSLEAPVRAFMEPRFGYDFSQVRVHTDERAAESARSVNALAYTLGRSIVFGPGQYAPWTYSGRELLAHELVHVIQQQSLPASRLQRRIIVENPTDPLPGTPPRQHWQDIRDDISKLCPSFSVSSSGVVAPSSTSACSTPPGSTACRCLCDLHNSINPDPWKIKIDERAWPHTEEFDRRVTTHSTRSIFSFGAWGGGAWAGRRISEDMPGVLAHELCGHAWLMELGIHPPLVASAGGRPSHDPTIAIENMIAGQRGVSAANLRGMFADLPHHGESFARVTITGFPIGSSDVTRLSPAMQARIATVRDFLVSDPSAIVDVIGHGDHTGMPTVTNRISSDRARNVLVALGIASTTPPRFRDVEGRGDTECPSSSVGSDPNCRKVDIFIFVFEAASETFP